MCLICVDFQKEKMTLNDAKRAYREMVVTMDDDHAREVKAMLQKAEKEQKSTASNTSTDPSTP